MARLRTADDDFAERERQMFARAASGSIADLERVFDECADGLYAFALSTIGRDASLAEQVVQATLARALDDIDRYDPERGTLGAWLCQISRDVARGVLRAHRRSEELFGIGEPLDRSLVRAFAAFDQELIPKEVLERAETRDLVDVTLGYLPERYRLVLVLTYVEGASQRELARRFEVSEDAIPALLARASRAFWQDFVALGHELAKVSS